MPRSPSLIGQRLRHTREARGLTLDEVSFQTRIAKRYLAALEAGDLSSFPPGPFLAGYTRQYERFLGLEGKPFTDEETASLPPARPHEETTTTTRRVPWRFKLPRVTRQNLRMGVGGLVAFLVFVLAMKLLRVALAPSDAGPGEIPDQTVVLRAIEPVEATVWVDGKEVFEGALPPGQDMRFDGHDRIEVEIQNLSLVTLIYNQYPLKPLGAQSRSRRLVFIDDEDSRPL